MVFKSKKQSFFVPKNSQRFITEAQRKKYQHELANWIKRHGKDTLEKGPEVVEVKITGNMLVLSIAGYLTKYEKFILRTESSSIVSIKESRLQADMAVIRNGELDNYIEEYLDVRVLGHMFDAMIEDDFCLWIIVLDTYLTL